MSVFIGVPLFPNVPLAPGVPPVARAPGPLELLPELLSGDVSSVLSLFLAPQWGIFDDNGDPAVTADSVLSIDFRKEYRISDYPVEEGGFASYNKVAVPFDARVRFITAESQANRSFFLFQIDQVVQSLDLYTVVTPDASYVDANITHYDYRREMRNGISMIIVDVWVEEVRQTGTSQFAANTATPSGAKTSEDGTVQPTKFEPAANTVVT